MKRWYSLNLYGSVKQSFFIAIVLIFALTFINFLLYTYHIGNNRELTKYLFFVMQERALIIESALVAEDLVDTRNIEERKAYATRLHKIVHEIEIRHKSLLKKKSFNSVVRVAPDEVSSLYTDQKLEMDELIQRYLDEFNAFLKEDLGTLTVANKHYQYINRQFSRQTIIPKLNSLLSDFEYILVQRVNSLFWINGASFAAVVLLLVFIVTVNFIPAFRRLDQYTEELHDVNEKLQKELEERQRIEKELRESETLFRGLTDNSPIAVWLTDETGSCTYLSKYWLDYTGVAMEEQLGDNWTRCLHHEELESTFNQFRAALETKTTFTADYRLKRYDGRYRWFQASGIPNYDSTGKFIGYIGVSFNISNRKAYENNIQQLNKKLEITNKQLQDFAVIASHDLQEPLRKIIAFHERVKDITQGQLSPQAEDYIERITKATTRMQQLIQDLLSYSRITTRGSSFAPVKLNDIFANVLQDLEMKIQENSASITITSKLPEIEADKTQLYQLFLNILLNALKYKKSDTSPQITVSLHPLDSTCKINHALVYNPSNYIQLKISDNGIGFENQYAEKVFGAFQRLHGRSSPYEGTGMGLAICRQIVQRHNGVIYAESEPGKGTRFYIVLPVSQERILEINQDEHPIFTT